MSVYPISEWQQLAGKEISLAEDYEALSSILNRVALTLGFDRFSCVLSTTASFKSRGFQVVGGCFTQASEQTLPDWMLSNGVVIHDCVNDDGMVVWGGSQSYMGGMREGRSYKGDENFGVACVVIPRFSVTGIVCLVRATKDICNEEYSDLSRGFKFIAMQAVYKAVTLNDGVHAYKGVSLSSKEIQVLRCIADGDTSKQAAKILYVSVDTVNFHLKRIYRKLGVGNKAQAAAYAAIHGLI